MTERLDLQLLNELEILMEEDFTSLLETYLRDSENRLFEVSEAWEAHDMERLERHAHSLKGASGNIGAAELATLCGELELLAREDSTERLPGMLDQVKSELREVREAVQALRDSR
ncbi:MAG: Hpt domain-containing protein [Pseudomonadales bacterium]